MPDDASEDQSADGCGTARGRVEPCRAAVVAPRHPADLATASCPSMDRRCGGGESVGDVLRRVPGPVQRRRHDRHRYGAGSCPRSPPDLGQVPADIPEGFAAIATMRRARISRVGRGSAGRRVRRLRCDLRPRAGADGRIAASKSTFPVQVDDPGRASSPTVASSAQVTGSCRRYGRCGGQLRAVLCRDRLSLLHRRHEGVPATGGSSCRSAG